MANMAHCRFTNTLGDLRDAYEHMSDPALLESEESKARRRLILLCVNIALEYGDEVDRPVTPE